MTAEQISALGRTLFAGLATGLGGLLALGPKPTPRALAGAMGFAAGVMTAVSLTDLLPTALGWYRRAFSPEGAALALVSLLCMGMALAALLERCLPEQPGRGLDERRAGALRSALITGAALVLHNLPEGVLTLFAGAADSALGLRMALAVALHNLPEGLAVALPLYYATGSRRQAVGAAFASGLAEPVDADLGDLRLLRAELKRKLLFPAVRIDILQQTELEDLPLPGAVVLKLPVRAGIDAD